MDGMSMIKASGTPGEALAKPGKGGLSGNFPRGDAKLRIFVCCDSCSAGSPEPYGHRRNDQRKGMRPGCELSRLRRFAPRRLWSSRPTCRGM